MAGKYRHVRKEVVSDFFKELIGWMDILNRARNYQLPRRGSKSLFFLEFTNRCLRNPYKSLRTSSTAFRYLALGLSRSAEFFESTGLRKAAEFVREMGWGFDFNCPSNDLFPGLCLLRLRPFSLDARQQA
jgi:hypothetical protein